jgi:hypothetical protein
VHAGPTTSPPRLQRPVSTGSRRTAAAAAAAESRAVGVTIAVQVRVWAEYFNNVLKCWEGLLDPWHAWVLLETGTARGSGASVRAVAPLHLNVTGALLDTLADVQQRVAGQLTSQLSSAHIARCVSTMRAAALVTPATSNSSTAATAAGPAHGRVHAGGHSAATVGRAGAGHMGAHCDELTELYTPGRGTEDEQTGDEWCATSTTASTSPASRRPGHVRSAHDQQHSALVAAMPVPISHQYYEPLELDSRMAFTILNLTGQRVRFFQPRANDAARRLQVCTDNSQILLLSLLCTLILLSRAVACLYQLLAVRAMSSCLNSVCASLMNLCTDLCLFQHT